MNERPKKYDDIDSIASSAFEEREKPERKKWKQQQVKSKKKEYQRRRRRKINEKSMEMPTKMR